jgi:hypothetical protein
MPQISLTDFVDIVSTSGTPKFTKVKEIKNRPPYAPAADFYKALRDRIIEVHQKGLDYRYLQTLVKFLSDRKKVINYPALINGYRKWLGRKELKWFAPAQGLWSAHGIEVRVNPELGLEVNGKNHLIKLYFKADKLSKTRTDIITHLMESSLRSESPGATMGVLDIRNSKLLCPTVPIPGLSVALDGELAYIAALWEQI